MAQWLGRGPLAHGLSLTSVWFMVDRWPLCGYTLRCRSAN